MMINPKLKLKENIQLFDSPHELSSRIIQANTFDNPKYESNQKHGYSNWETPSTIETFKQHNDGSLTVPRGYARGLLALCKELNITPEIEDLRSEQPIEFPSLEGITLRPYQERAVEAAMKFDQGCLISPTGSGKSLIGLEIIRQQGQKALIIVHRSDLAKQWADVIEKRMGLKVGMVGDGEWEIGDQITIAMTQTLSVRENETKALSNAFGLILCDEVHHAPAMTFFDVLGLLNAKYRYGLSATPNRRDGLEQMIYRAIGPAIATITKKEVESLGATVPVSVRTIETNFNPGCVNSWNEYLSEITTSAERNQLIIDLTQKSDGAVLVLVDRVAHAEQLSDMLIRREIQHILAHGQIDKKDREDLMERIKIAKLTVGTTSLIGEGLDVSVWGTLIMGSPISSEIKLMQAIGRIVRPSKETGKERAIVYDLQDSHGFSGSSFKNRLGIYRKHNIHVDFGNKPSFSNDQNAPWRNLKPTEKQIIFLKSTGCENIDTMTRGEAADLIGSGRTRKAG